MLSNETRKNFSIAFGRLRLSAAHAVFSSFKFKHLVESASTEDISYIPDLIELCDQYALRALVEWLLDGLADSGSKNELVSLLRQRGEYPFADTDDDDEVMALISSQANMLMGAKRGMELGLIGDLYEHLFKFPLQYSAEHGLEIALQSAKKAERRQTGQFYTPPDAVKRCLTTLEAGIRQRFDSGCSLKVLDPSCGSGNFLIGVVSLFADLNPDPGAQLAFIKHSIFGIDLDGRAACLTRVSLMIVAASIKSRSEGLSEIFSQLRAHIRNTDTIFSSPESTSIENANSIEYFSNSWFTESQQFDLVVTNPPYVSFGARNQPTLPDSTAKYLRSVFPSSAEYKIRLHSIFQELALRYCKDDGVAGLLVPDGFLTGGYYKKLRQLLSRNAEIQALSEFPPDTISGAVVGRWIFAVYRKRRSDGTNVVHLHSTIPAIPEVYSLKQSELISNDCHRFRMIFTDTDKKLMLTVDQMAVLATIASGHTGIRSRHGQEAIVRREPQSETWKRGIRSGACVRPYSVTWDGTWLNVDEKLLYRGGYNPHVIGNPKLLIRQTGDRITAGLDEDGLFHLNNVHSLSLHEYSSDKLGFLSALANSNFWLYIYRLKTRESGRAMAQIDIETLESMPVPKENYEIEARLANLVKQYTSQIAETQCRIQQDIDRLVYTIFQLDQATIDHIERACGKLSTAVAEEISCH